MVSSKFARWIARHGGAKMDTEEKSNAASAFPHHPAAPPGQHGNEGTVPSSSMSHYGVAEPNLGLKDIREDASNLATWDAWHYYALKMKDSFGNWNNRQVLKRIEASPSILRTYHDSFLFGEVPISVKLRATIRSGFFGSVWNVNMGKDFTSW